MFKKIALFFPLILCISLSSCYDGTNTFGEQFAGSSFRNVSIDSSTVVITAVLMDSIETSGKSTALIGKYIHKDWGTVTAFPFIPYNRPAYSTDIDEKVVMDSLILKLNYAGFSAGDTTQYQHFTVHRLTEQVALNDNGYLYNTSSAGYDPEILGEGMFKPRPGSGEAVEIKLSDLFCEDLLKRFHARDEAVSADHFEEYFKGIVILPVEQSCASLQNFAVSDSSCIISLHYHIVKEHKETQVLVFSPNTSNQFNHVDHNKSGSLLEDYTSDKEIRSEFLDQKSLVFSGIGWYSRLEFPYLNNLMMHGEQIEIQSAILKIHPTIDSYSGLNTLPDSLYLYIADENNVVVNAVTDYLGTEVQRGTLVKDDTFGENTYYYFDVTTFMNEELGTFGIYKHNLQLVFNNDTYTKTLRNLTFGNQNGKLPVTLQLSYKIYESY